MPIINDTNPTTIAFIRHFLLFIFYYSAFESLSNCMESSAIIDDFRSAVSSSVMLFTSLFTLPLIMSYNSITLLLRLSTFEFALNSFMRSSILYFSFYFSFARLNFFYIYTALFKKFDAIDIDEAYFEIKTICVNYDFYAEL